MIKSIILLTIHGMLFSEVFDFISFDFSDQFGYARKDGILLCNQDWYSKNLMFDGTWSNFPKTYGPFIANGYIKNRLEIEKVDSNIVTSNFKYEQGDFLLDMFLFNLKYKSNFRNIKLNGFKRSYIGPYNQYYNGTNQPIQQSYVLSYDSHKSTNSGGGTIGHFNTYIGLPDTIAGGFMDNKITNLNVFFSNKTQNIRFFSSMDQYMQRYKVLHSKSIFQGARYLSRSKYFFGIEYFQDNEKIYAFNLVHNFRNVRMDTINQIYWDQIDFMIKKGKFDYKFGVNQYEDSNDIFYNIKFKKRIRFMELILINSKLNKISHPYYSFYSNIKSSFIYQIRFSKFQLSWLNKGRNSSISYVSYEELNNKSISNIKSNSNFKNHFNFFQLNYWIDIFSNLEIELDYQYQNPYSYYSLGFGNRLKINSYSRINLFNENMKIDFILGFMHLGNRQNTPRLNFIEMVPIENITIQNQEDINFFSSSISISVSDFIIKYEWKNITEIIFRNLNIEKENLIIVNPELPPMIGQMNFSVEWQFQD